MELRADGLSLRHPVEADAAQIAAAVNESLDELAPWMPWATPTYGRTHAQKWIDGEFGDAHRFVVIDEASQLVGTCALNRVDEQNHAANLGYWIRSDRTGAGHATTATKLVARHALEQVELHRIEVIMSTRNERSRRVAEKAGAYYEGVSRGALLLHDDYHDVHRWSFVRGDPIDRPGDGVGDRAGWLRPRRGT